jgi:hypothetical protein
MGKDYAAICADPERKLQEWERVRLYLNDKYKNDPVFRAKKKQYQKDYRANKLREMANKKAEGSPEQ